MEEVPEADPYRYSAKRNLSMIQMKLGLFHEQKRP